MIALIGIILLIGIVKKNAIMMIDFALEAERKEGKSAVDAIYEASLLRFRPIMMTTMAALLGALPLAVSTGMGAELRRPLGIAIVGGLILSQILTLYTTPVVYLAFDRLAKRIGERRASRSTREAGPARMKSRPPLSGGRSYTCCHRVSCGVVPFGSFRCCSATVDSHYPVRRLPARPPTHGDLGRSSAERNLAHRGRDRNDLAGSLAPRHRPAVDFERNTTAPPAMCKRRSMQPGLPAYSPRASTYRKVSAMRHFTALTSHMSR